MDFYVHPKMHLLEAYKAGPAVFVPDSTGVSLSLSNPPYHRITSTCKASSLARLDFNRKRITSYQIIPQV